MRRTSIWLAAVLLLLGACSDDDERKPLTQPADLTAIEVSNDLETKPTVTFGDGAPPVELYTRDIVLGDGDEAVAGQNISVHYVGIAWSDKKQFDASWDRGDPLPFTLGAGHVIPGWDRGVAGMKVGGRRLIVIPPDLGYGPAGGGPIKPNETLVFVVDLEKVG